MTQSSGKISLPAVLIAAVCVVVAAAHWPALSARALSIDDQMYLTKNVMVQNPGWASTKRFLTEVLKPSTVRGYYQPLAMISLMLDYAAGGREDNLRPFHITSLALHTANTALIIVLLYLLFGNILAAAAVGLLFGVHPMTVEPIPWVGERKTLLAAFFALWSLILYVRYARRGNWKSYAGCFLMYLLALMSKPTSVPLPLVMLLMDYWPVKRLNIKTFLEKLPLFVTGGIFALITYISQYQTAGLVSPTKSGPEHIFLVLCHNIIFYIYKIILPVNLSSHYAFPKTVGLSNSMILAGVVGTGILIPLLLISLRWTRAALTGWLIFFVAILPTMQVIGFSDVIASDKFAYLPSIGLLMIIASFLIWLGKNKKVTIAVAVVILTLAGTEAVATQRYLVYWRDSITLINHMLMLSPDSAPLYDGRGSIYFDKSEYNRALSDFNKALDINPRYAKAYSDRGITYYRKGEYDLAVSDQNKAIEINPRSAEAYNNRGAAYFGKGELDHAISDFTKAIEINPRSADAYNNRGNAYGTKGELNRAISDYNKAIEINPKHAGAYYNRGAVYVRCKGQLDHAISDFTKAIEINPRYNEAYNNRGIAYSTKGELDRAISDYNKAIEINPKNAGAYCNRGNTYSTKGELNRAISDFTKAIEINPKYYKAYFNKAIACTDAGRKKEAVEAYKAFIKCAPAQDAHYIEVAKQRIRELEQ